MSTTAEFTVDAESFPLGSSFRDLSGITVELEKVIPTNRAVVPYLWVSGVDGADVRATLHDHRATQEVTIVESIEDRHLLRVDWNPPHEGFMDIIVAANVVFLSADGTAETWKFAIRGDDHASISDFQARCRDAGIPIELTSLAELSGAESDRDYGLTGPQREALELAYERGYFDSPRETTLEALAADLDISRQALAARLRRGHRRLIENTIEGP